MAMGLNFTSAITLTQVYSIVDVDEICLETLGFFFEKILQMYN